ncbi:MAG TPA: hypothetical protein VL523_00795 [Terriglobia bacterium]|nr:hypothetical protein [Terriglobia bacterium]
MKLLPKVTAIAGAFALVATTYGPVAGTIRASSLAVQAQGGEQSGKSTDATKSAPKKRKQSSNRGVISGEQGGARGLTPPARTSAPATRPRKRKASARKSAGNPGRSSHPNP